MTKASGRESPELTEHQGGSASFAFMFLLAAVLGVSWGIWSKIAELPSSDQLAAWLVTAGGAVAGALFVGALPKWVPHLIVLRDTSRSEAGLPPVFLWIIAAVIIVLLRLAPTRLLVGVLAFSVGAVVLIALAAWRNLKRKEVNDDQEGGRAAD